MSRAPLIRHSFCLDADLGKKAQPFAQPLVLALLLIGGLPLLVGCDGNGDTSPLYSDNTPIPTTVPTVVGAIPPSATVDPHVVYPTALVGGNVNVLDFTPAGISTPDRATVMPPTATPNALKLYISTSDRLLIGRYYPATVRRLGISALLLPSETETQDAWPADFLTQLQSGGYSALTLDLRGFGLTGGQADWSKTPTDAQTALQYLHAQPNIDSNSSIVIGAGVGATIALSACASDPGCQTAVLISPRLSIHNLSTQNMLKAFGAKRALMIVAAAEGAAVNDATALDKAATGPHRLQFFGGHTDALALLNTHPEVGKAILDWLAALRN